MTLTHNWNSTESATVTYTGSGSGSIQISSSKNEGVDRSFNMHVTAGSKTVTVKVVQSGRREVFNDKNGAFLCKDGSEFLTIK